MRFNNSFIIRKFSEFSLRTKFITGFMIVSMLSVGLVSGVAELTIRPQLKADIARNLHSLSKSQATAIGNLLARQISALNTLSRSALVVTAVRFANASYAESLSADPDMAIILAEIMTLHEQWQTAENTDPLIRKRLVGVRTFREFRRLFPDHKDIFITDQYGALTAATYRTPFYYYGDKVWWQAASDNGQGNVYIGLPEFNDSSRNFDLMIAVPIRNPGTQEVIGILHSSYCLDEFVDLLASVRFGETGEFNLYFPNSTVLRGVQYTSELSPGLVPVQADTADSLTRFTPGTTPFLELNYNGTPCFLGQTRITSATGEPDIGHLNWRVIAHIKRDEALLPVQQQTSNNLRLALIITTVSIIGGIIVSQRLTTPIARLTEDIRIIASGNFEKSIQSGRKDEIGQLITDVDKMRLSVMQASKELERLLNEVRVKNAKLERLDKFKDEFLANISHELRTPLNGIIGIAESLTGGDVGPLTEKQQYNLSLIVWSGRRLTNLVNDILDFSKMRQKKLQLWTKPVNMRTVADMVLTLSQPSVGNKNIRLVNQIPPDLPAAEADENRVQQILHNLVANAVKFTEKGMVTISARIQDEHFAPAELANPGACPGLPIQTEQKSIRQQYLAVTVSDTGIGIPEDKLEVIFGAFEQADGSTEREYGGTGLGLAITRNLVNLHGGLIQADSEPGKGSDFSFTLPVSDGKAEALQVADILRLPARIAGISGKPSAAGYAEAPEEQADIDVPPKHLCGDTFCNVLAVDDEPINLQVLKNHLISEYFLVTAVTSGKEALAALEGEHQFDIVLLDIMMPEMSGYEVCQRIRKKYLPNELPVVMLTAKNQVEDMVAGFGAGASDYLTKPFFKHELISRIDTHVSLKYLHISQTRAITEAKLLRQEIEFARNIQTALLPERLNMAGYDIAACCEPADEVGGDYYDVISIAGYNWLVIGDVSGHGLTSGLVMMMVQTAIHTVLIEYPDMLPSDLLSVVNKIIYNNLKRMDEAKHMSIIILAVGMDGNFSFAGMHEDILIWRADAGKVDTIETDGMWIGLEPDISQWLSTKTLRLDSGDCMVLFTDGITEARDKDCNFFGDKLLVKIIEESGHRPASEIRKKITDTLEPWEKPDDVTFVVVKRK